jgi:hypothetical protein
MALCGDLEFKNELDEIIETILQPNLDYLSPCQSMTVFVFGKIRGHPLEWMFCLGMYF